MPAPSQKKTIQVYSASEAKRKLGDLVDQVKYRSTCFGITLFTYPFAVLVPEAYVPPNMLKHARREQLSKARVKLRELVDWVTAKNGVVVITKNTANIKRAVLIPAHVYEALDVQGVTLVALPAFDPPSCLP